MPSGGVVSRETTEDEEKKKAAWTMPEDMEDDGRKMGGSELEGVPSTLK